jgi:hypothetical protein
MSKAVRLGDCRRLEHDDPRLFNYLMREMDLTDEAFRSPEFDIAMRDTRRGVMRTLCDFLDNETQASQEREKIGRGMTIGREVFLRSTDLSTDPEFMKTELMRRLRQVLRLDFLALSGMLLMKTVTDEILLDPEVRACAAEVSEGLQRIPGRQNDVFAIQRKFQLEQLKLPQAIDFLLKNGWQELSRENPTKGFVFEMPTGLPESTFITVIEGLPEGCSRIQDKRAFWKIGIVNSDDIRGSMNMWVAYWKVKDGMRMPTNSND